MNATLLAPSKRDLLKQWMKAQGVFRTHQVIAWGLEHNLNRALRDKGEFHRLGLIRELTKEERATRGLPKTAESYYEWVSEPAAEPNGQLSFLPSAT